MRVKLSLAGEGGGCTPLSLHLPSPVKLQCTRSSWVGRHINPVSSLGKYVLCGWISTYILHLSAGYTPHPHQPGLILPSWLNVRQKAAVATFGDFVTILTEGSMQDNHGCKTTDHTSTDSTLPPLLNGHFALGCIVTLCFKPWDLMYLHRTHREHDFVPCPSWHWFEYTYCIHYQQLELPETRRWATPSWYGTFYNIINHVPPPLQGWGGQDASMRQNSTYPPLWTQSTRHIADFIGLDESLAD